VHGSIYTGLVQQTARLAKAAEADEPTDWADQYMRLSIRFETGAPRYGMAEHKLVCRHDVSDASSA
jgi:hypothetical protein